jgi:archaellum biogenesis protein FlaJ (TadC family)
MGYFIALFLLLIIASLASAGFFMLRRKDQGLGDEAQKKSAQSRGMARALTIRIGLSVVLFISVLIAWQLGLIQPTGLPLK